MTRHELPWLLLGICIGIFIGAWLFANRPQPTPPEADCAEAGEPPLEIVESERKLG